jgi:hypothetical protein
MRVTSSSDRSGRYYNPGQVKSENASAFDPERSPGVSEATINPETRNNEKAANSIEGIGHGLVDKETPKLLSGSEIYQIWVMQCTKQE